MGKKFPSFPSPPCLVEGLRRDANLHLFPSNVNQAYAMSSEYNVTADSHSKITVRNRFGMNKIIKVILFVPFLKTVKYFFFFIKNYRFWTFRVYLSVCSHLMLLPAH